ncbi:hypothetical protein [Pseudomonas mohnii]
MNMQTSELLPVVVNGRTFYANQDRMWNLNEIQKGLGLPDSKSPSKWDNEISRALEASRNFVKVDKVGSFADELGTIAYAMWVSPEFYLMVASAFVAMRNNAVGELRSAKTLLDANMPKASTLDMKARGAGLTWTEACRVAGIQQPRLALDALVSMGSFVHPKDNFGDRVGTPRPHKSGFEKGAFVKASSEFGNREGWRVKPRGLDWLRNKAEEINLKVAEKKAQKSRAKLAAKQSTVKRVGRPNVSPQVAQQ